MCIFFYFFFVLINLVRYFCQLQGWMTVKRQEYGNILTVKQCLTQNGTRVDPEWSACYTRKTVSSLIKREKWKIKFVIKENQDLYVSRTLEQVTRVALHQKETYPIQDQSQKLQERRNVERKHVVPSPSPSHSLKPTFQTVDQKPPQRWVSSLETSAFRGRALVQ